MNDSAERRTETRLYQQTTIFIEVCSANFDDKKPAQVIICNSVDISANGIQVQMDEHVAMGTILRLCAEFTSGKEPMYLVGEVKWVGEQDEGFNIGFELLDAEGTDIIEWKNIIADQLQ